MTAAPLTLPILIPGESELDRQFWTFHNTHPEVYDALVRLARQGIAAGRKRLGIGQLYEVLRWNMALATGDDGFRLNNNHRSRYALLIMDREPDLAGVFETRRLSSEAAS